MPQLGYRVGTSLGRDIGRTKIPRTGRGSIRRSHIPQKTLGPFRGPLGFHQHSRCNQFNTPHAHLTKPTRWRNQIISDLLQVSDVARQNQSIQTVHITYQGSDPSHVINKSMHLSPMIVAAYQEECNPCTSKIGKRMVYIYFDTTGTYLDSSNRGRQLPSICEIALHARIFFFFKKKKERREKKTPFPFSIRKPLDVPNVRRYVRSRHGPNGTAWRKMRSDDCTCVEDPWSLLAV
ncbi:hypothetical protein F4818DRAFT_367723 [Hypoxylon cercidicola]|nr:hypothetical protein F4818DRAFT_367723 [Hypoxylon cercidicola]